MNTMTLIAVGLAGWMNRQQQDVIEYLREEVRVLKEIVGLVTPQTLLAWHRQLIAKKYDSSGKRCRVGCPPTKEELRDLVIRMAEENRGWGYTRFRGAMANLGHEIGRGTIAEISKQGGLEPAPERERKGTWAEFLRTHWEVMGATDFFTVELWKWGGLVRYHVLFVIRLSSREVHNAGIVPEPDGRWMKQIGRNLTDCVDGFLSGSKIFGGGNRSRDAELPEEQDHTGTSPAEG